MQLPLCLDDDRRGYSLTRRWGLTVFYSCLYEHNRVGEWKNCCAQRNLEGSGRVEEQGYFFKYFNP